MRGTIALDIDGTVMPSLGSMTERVACYLAHLSGSGWRLVFITGRPYASARRSLSHLGFVHYLAPQNGAVILEMPGSKVLLKKYLERSIFKEMEAICRDEPTDFVVYGGLENNDQCYFRPDYFSKELLAYLEKRCLSFEEVWHPMETYDKLPIEEFPAVKCFGTSASLKGVADRIEKRLGLHVPLIRDPFGEGFYVAQATHQTINKGQALLDLIALTGERGTVIAAGDDFNDLPMFAAADISIVMGTAPIDLLDKGDIIAPPAEEDGIITGLEMALNSAKAQRTGRSR